MREAAQLLVGRHDFSAFADKKRPAGLGNQKRKRPGLSAAELGPVRGPGAPRSARHNIRVLAEARVYTSDAELARGQHVTVQLTGSGFLYRMVRMIAVALVEVGHHRLTPAQLQQLMLAGNRGALPQAAPPQGLTLDRVYYAEDMQRLRNTCDLHAWPALEEHIHQLTTSLEVDNTGRPKGKDGERLKGVAGVLLQNQEKL